MSMVNARTSTLNDSAKARCWNIFLNPKQMVGAKTRSYDLILEVVNLGATKISGAHNQGIEVIREAGEN